MAPTSTPQSGPASPFNDNLVEVEVGEPFLITRSPEDFAYLPGYPGIPLEPYHFLSLQQVDAKRLFMKLWTSPDASLTEEELYEVAVWTEDGGRSWGRPVLLNGQQAGGHSFIRRGDGACLWLSYFTRPVDGKTVSFNYGLSRDGRTFDWRMGRAVFPEAVALQEAGNARMDISRSIVELDDGSLLATMYGRFEGDRLDRSVLMRSTDGGATWEFRTTLGYDPAVAGQGFNEPCLARLSNGDLLCVMRNKSCRPMYAARSTDDGLTFSLPEPLPEYARSVFPDLVEMSHGVVALSFGRPGSCIMFSLDGGRRWTGETTIFPGTGGDGYTAIREVEPGRLLYCYQEGEHTNHPASMIRGVFIDVRRQAAADTD